MRAAPALGILFALALGIAMGERCALSTDAWAALSLLLLAATLWANRRRQGTVVLALLCLGCAGAWRVCCVEVVRWDAWPRAAGTSKGSVQARMRLVGPVRLVTPEGGPNRLRVRARLLAIAQDGLWQPQAGEGVLHLWPGAAIATGDTLIVPVQLKAAPTPRNVGDVAARTWMRRSGLSGRVQVRGAYVVEAYGPFYLSGLDRWRQRCSARLRHALSPTAAPLARAMAIGDAAGVQIAMRQVWADAGIAHLLAVSGMHLALVMAVAARLTRLCLRLGVGCAERYHVQKVSDAVSLVCGAVFAALSGEGWAALRAWGMAAMLVLGRVTGRPQTALQALGVVGAFLLWLWPMALFDLGFQLSFTVVAALLLWAAPTHRARSCAKPKTRWQWAWRLFAASLRVCAVAQLASAPLCAHAFGRLSCTAALINLVAIPIASAAVVLGLGCAVLGPEPTSYVAHITDLVFTTLDWLARGASRWPLASIWAPRSAGLWQFSLLVLFACITLRVQSEDPRVRAWAQRSAWASALGMVLSFGLAFDRSAGNGRLQIDHLYVGQGDATLITFPQGLTMLVDGGGILSKAGSDPGRWAVAAALDHRGIRRIDVMVLTHPHPDHLGGLLYIAERYPVGTLWLNGDGLGFRDVRTLIKSVRQKGGQVGPAPLSWDVEGVALTSHAPLAGTWASANDHALVLKLVLGARSIVLAGDVEGRAEALLAPAIGQTDLIKAGHHGSSTSSSKALLDALKPRAVVISCGEDNSFGFPHAQTLTRLQAHQIAVWRTDTMGALHLETDGQSWHARGVDGQPWCF